MSAITVSKKVLNHECLSKVLSKKEEGISLDISERVFVNEIIESRKSLRSKAIKVLFFAKSGFGCRSKPVIDSNPDEKLAAKILVIKNFLQEKPYLSERKFFQLYRLLEEMTVSQKSAIVLIQGIQNSSERNYFFKKKLAQKIILSQEKFFKEPSREGESIFDGENYQILIKDGVLSYRDDVSSLLSDQISQMVSCALIEKIKQIYVREASSKIYNTFGEYFDFLSWYRLQVKRDPKATLREAYETYNPNYARVFEKYRSGSCATLACYMYEMISSLKIKVKLCGSLMFHQATMLPVPGRERVQSVWNGMISHLRFMTHTSVNVLFEDESHRKKLLHLECSVEREPKEDISMHEIETKSSFLAALENSDSYFEYHDIKLFGKRRLESTFKLVFKDQSAIIGIDLLKGNFYLNAKMIDDLGNLPLLNDKVSLSFGELNDSTLIQEYRVEDKLIPLSAEAALDLVLQRIKKKYLFPEDFKDNILFLAAHHKKIVDELMLKELKLIYRFYDTIKVLHEKLRYLFEIKRIDVKKQIKELDDLIEKLPSIDQDLFENRLEALTKELLEFSRVLRINPGTELTSSSHATAV